MDNKKLKEIFENSKPNNLVKNYDTPFFVFFPEIMKIKINQLKKSLKQKYTNSQLTYSVKTNYLPFVVNKAYSYGAYPECISGFEILIVEKLNLLNKNTVVNGPLKSEEDLIKISKLGCKINIDNFTELKIVQKIAKKLSLKLEIGIRVYSKLEKETWSRFGFDLDNNEALHIAEKINKNMPNLELVGLQVHIGTNILDFKLYENASKKISEFASFLEKRRLIKLKYLDMGGGFATNLPLKKNFKKKICSIPTENQYIKAIINPIKKTFKKRLPKLILELGRFLVDESFFLVTKVKRFRGKKMNSVILDAGVNILPSGKYRNHEFFKFSNMKGKKKKYNLFGPLCMQFDCFRNDIELVDLKQDDILYTTFAGAYSLSQSWNFIQFSPPVIAFDKKKFILLKRKQNLNDLLCRDIFTLRKKQ